MSWFTLFTTTKTTSTATAAIKEQPVDSKKHIATAQKRTEKTKNPAVYSTKSTCTITKPTLVNVTIDATRDEFTACRALSIELAKRSSRSPCTSRRSSQTFHSETSRRSLSLLYSASPPPKATVSLLSTSVSVTGASTEHKSTATAFESLSTLKDELLLDNDNGTDKADNDDKNDQQEELQKPQQKHDADIVSPSTMSIRGQEEKRWSWFRFSSYTSSLSNLSHQQSKTEVNLGKQQLTDSPKAMSLADQPSASTSASTAMTHKEKHSLLSKGIAQQEQSDKSLATCSSASSLKKKRNNIVLPTFETEFVAKTTHDDDNNDDNDAPAPLATKERAHIETKKPHFIIRAIEAINSVLIEPPPSRQTKSTPAVDFDWLAKQMHTKFARFVEEIKSSDHTKKHNWVDKRITIIGTHGWFPMKLVRSMIGEPTGTSKKFCEQMSHCVKLYFEKEHQVTIPDDAITIVPLEGEGKIQDRVELLYQKLIENPVWLEAVSSADVILWATHSQGTPVSTILLQRLLERGHIHTFRQSVCMLAMAGISHGPFPSLRESLLVKYFEADAARELFEFMDSSSSISIKFRQSLSYILKCGTRVVLTGSMKDQVVPLYSAIMTATQHPNILRQLYIDEHLYSEKDFLVNLIVLLVKIRNRGHSDHHLLTYLSEILAGSPYAIEGGHSTIYEDLGVYMTAVRYTFETGPFGRYTRANDHAEERNWWSHHEEPTLDEFRAQQTFNPFYLPWALQGVCTDANILKDDALRQELQDLIKLFDEWKPASAKLKELKFKLEPFKSTQLV